MDDNVNPLEARRPAFVSPSQEKIVDVCAPFATPSTTDIRGDEVSLRRHWDRIYKSMYVGTAVTPSSGDSKGESEFGREQNCGFGGLIEKGYLARCLGT